jgi:hypothetical protein
MFAYNIRVLLPLDDAYQVRQLSLVTLR